LPLANASCGNASVHHVTSFGQLSHVRSYSVFRTALGMTELPCVVQVTQGLPLSEPVTGHFPNWNLNLNRKPRSGVQPVLNHMWSCRPPSLKKNNGIWSDYGRLVLNSMPCHAPLVGVCVLHITSCIICYGALTEHPCSNAFESHLLIFG
jgi:hypothetical protein